MIKKLLIAALLFTGCSLVEKEEGEKAKVVTNNLVRIESSNKLIYFQDAASYDNNNNRYVMAIIEGYEVVRLTDD